MIAQLDRLYIRTSIRKSLSRLTSYLFFEGRPLTTKGRWVNPLVFFLFQILKCLPTLKKVKEPVFIVGTGRSGTTVLGLVLSMHHNVSYLNEPKALWFSAVPADDLVGSYSREYAAYCMGKADVTKDIKHALHRLYGACLFATGGSRIVDKYPEMIFRVDFVREVFPDAKFIFLIRNGMDTISSIVSWVDNNGVNQKGEQHDWWGADDRKWRLLVSQVVASDPELKAVAYDIEKFTNQCDRAAVEWVLSMREGLKLLASSPNDIIPLRYEALVEAPQKELSNILRFCNLPMDKRFMGYATSKLADASLHQEIKLHSAILPAFKQTMEALNYEC